MRCTIFLMAMLMTIALSPARAQDDAHPAGDDMLQETPPGMDDVNMQGMAMSPAEASPPDASLPPAVRDPHAAVDVQQKADYEEQRALARAARAHDESGIAGICFQ